MSSSNLTRTKVFISYSHRDAKWLARIETHLKPLKRKYEIDIWSDTKIKPGSNWKEEIAKAIKAAKVAILLVSADFLSSDFIASNELPPLLSAAEKEGALILPVILSPSYFSKTETLSQFQAVNDPSRPVINISKNEQEKLFVKLAEEVEASFISAFPTEKLQNRVVTTSNKTDIDARIENLLAMFPDIRTSLKCVAPGSSQKKILLVGAFAVGKTSLVQRFVDSIYSDKYHTTVAVKIDKKLVEVHGRQVLLLIWDTVGDNEVSEIRRSHFRGAEGYLLVADGTRLSTVKTAIKIHQAVVDICGSIPFVFLVNKSDLLDEWELDVDDSFFNRLLVEKGWHGEMTSAKSGFGVEEAFIRLTEKMIVP